MKKIFLFILILISVKSFSQTDSSRATITVSVQARDLSYISNFTDIDPIFEDLDSVMKTKFRVASPPSGTTNVSIAGVPVRAWWWMLLKLSYDPIAINTNIVSRLSTLLSAAGNNWLSFRITRETNSIISQQQSFINSGAARLQKQADTQVIN
jgi:hypothetical protein